MNKSLSVKNKLLIAFGVIIIMIILLGSMGWFSLNSASKGFKSYREMAKDGVLMGRVQANMLMVRMNAKDYFIHGLQKDVNEFNTYYNKVQIFVKEAQKEIQNPNRAAKVDEIDKELKEYKEDFIKVQSLMRQRNQLVNEILNINGKKIEQLFTKLNRFAYKDNDKDASYYAGESIRSLLLARLYAMKFLKTNSSDDVKRVNEEFSKLNSNLEILIKEIQNPNRKQILSEISPLLNEYESAFKKLVSVIFDRNNIIKNSLDVIGPNVAKLTEDVKLNLKDAQDTIGPEVQASNELFTSLITIASIIVIIISLFFAITIPRTIINSLESLTLGLRSFFAFLNKEETNARKIDLDSDDEFGSMAKRINIQVNKIETSLRQDEKLINEVKNIVQKVEEGDLSQSIQGTTSNDSLNELKTIFNEMLSTLREKIASDLNLVSNNLEKYAKKDFTSKIDDNGEFAKQINSLIQIINNMLLENMQNGISLDKSSDNLLKNVEQLNKNSNEAAASLEETAASVEEITSIVNNNSEKITLMSGLANKLTSSANEGQALANKTTNAMEDINSQVSEINDAITVIDQIAFQTNILSLNAAVEAATAGEAGKGFAVVAQEVRNLASRSAEAAKEIKDIVEKANQKANDGKNTADIMIEGYNELNGNINEAIKLIDDVAIASKEQQAGIIQINDAISSLDEKTQQNANIASQTQEEAQKTDEISKLVVEKTNENNFIGKDKVQTNNYKKPSSYTSLNKEQKNTVKSKVIIKPQSTTNNLEIKSNISDDEWESF